MKFFPSAFIIPYSIFGVQSFKFQRSPPVGFLFNPHFTMRNGLSMSKISAKFQGSNRPGRTDPVNIIGNFRYDTLKHAKARTPTAITATRIRWYAGVLVGVHTLVCQNDEVSEECSREHANRRGIKTTDGIEMIPLCIVMRLLYLKIEFP